MTNHPRSPRAKFSMGQVIAVKSEQFRSGPKYFRIAIRNLRFGMNFYGDGENAQYQEALLRPLTKKEAGR